ncbi:hypothetical protein BDZ89DRAFT_1134060 [Hymenopellis radicata]|nr:hypothetical protein BDZ89DRAFT_1134060 [Hymenopellis radicata]
MTSTDDRMSTDDFASADNTTRGDDGTSINTAHRRPQRYSPGHMLEHRISLVEFTKLTLPTLYCYLTQLELLAPIYPSPLIKADDPPPSSLINPPRLIYRPPGPALSYPANRPLRDPKEPSRRRSSRLLEEEEFTVKLPPFVVSKTTISCFNIGIFGGWMHCMPYTVSTKDL